MESMEEGKGKRVGPWLRCTEGKGDCMGKSGGPWLQCTEGTGKGDGLGKSEGRDGPWFQ